MSIRVHDQGQRGHTSKGHSHCPYKASPIARTAWNWHWSVCQGGCARKYDPCFLHLHVSPQAGWRRVKISTHCDMCFHTRMVPDMFNCIRNLFTLPAVRNRYLFLRLLFIQSGFNRDHRAARKSCLTRQLRSGMFRAVSVACRKGSRQETLSWNGHKAIQRASVEDTGGGIFSNTRHSDRRKRWPSYRNCCIQTVA
jgi:hypothetical protein